MKDTNKCRKHVCPVSLVGENTKPRSLIMYDIPVSIPGTDGSYLSYYNVGDCYLIQLKFPSCSASKSS